MTLIDHPQIQYGDTVTVIGENAVRRVTKVLHDKVQLDNAVWKKCYEVTLVFSDLKRPETWPYAIKDKRMIYMIENADGVKEITISDFYLLVKERIITDDGDIWKLSGEAVRGGKFELEMSAADFADDQKLKRAADAASGPLDPVRSKMGSHLAPAIQTLSQKEKINTSRRFHSTGWRDGAFIIPGLEDASTSIALPSKLPYAVEKDADLTLGLQCLDDLMEAHDSEGLIVVTFMFQPPLAKLMQWDNERYALFVRGRTGSLKTSFTQAAMAMYGRGFMEDVNLIKFGEGATRNALMQIASHAADMPLLFDNFKPNTGWGHRDFVNLIHNILEGGDKERLNRSSQLRDSRKIHTWPVITGEDVPDTDAASLARVVVVPFDWHTTGINHKLAQAQAVATSGEFSAVGATWLRWLESEDGQRFAAQNSGRFMELRNEWARFLLETKPDMVNPMRVASNISTNQITFEAACAVPELSEIFLKHKDAYEKALEAIAGGMAQNTSVAIEAERFIVALRELLDSGRYVLRNTHDELGLQGIGWMDENDKTVYILPVMARRAVEDLLGRDDLNGLSNQALYSQLKERGYLATTSGTTTITKRIGNGVKRVLHLKHHAIETPENPKKPDKP